jgi:hypothetical protein
MNLTRRELLRNSALFGGTLFFARGLMACAVDPSEESVDQTEDGLVTCKPPVISANHGHTLVVSPADVAARVQKTYSIKGTSGHDHLVTITPAQFTTLGAGQAITVLSTNGAGHTHSVTVTCSVSTPPAACGRGASARSISANHGHSLTVPAADITAGATKTYSIQGTSPHAHQVTITAAQFAQLKRGQTLSVASSSVLAHVHTVQVACA